MTRETKIEHRCRLVIRVDNATLTGAMRLGVWDIFSRRPTSDGSALVDSKVFFQAGNAVAVHSVHVCD